MKHSGKRRENRSTDKRSLRAGSLSVAHVNVKYDIIRSNGSVLKAE
jgi:hypothetical protein